MTAGRWFVAVQGVLFLAVGVTGFLPGPTLWQSYVGGLAVIVVGVSGVLWAGRFLGRSLTPLPEPNGFGLVANGPYRWVRHPMYSALVVVSLGVALVVGVVWSYVTVLALCVFFAAKARYEERFLVRAYEGYEEYGAGVGRFVPFVGKLQLSTD